MTQAPSDGFEKILVIVVKRIGELLLATPAIRALKKSNPQAVLHAVCDEGYADVFRHNPYVDAVELLYPNTESRQVLKLARRLRKREYSVVIDFLANPRSAFLTLATGAPVRIGLDKRIRKYAYTDYLEPSPDATPYIADLRLNAARMLGAPSDGIELDFATSDTGEARAIELLAENHVTPDDNYIAFAPISLRKYKRYPYPYFAEVADTLRSRHNRRIVLLCGPNESDQLEQMQREMQSPPDALIECHTLDSLASLMKMSDLLVSNDSGVKHLGAAVRTKTVTVFGAGNKNHFDPDDKINHIACSANLSCRKPKCHRTCKWDYRCISMVKPEEVISAAETLLDRR